MWLGAKFTTKVVLGWFLCLGSKSTRKSQLKTPMNSLGCMNVATCSKKVLDIPGVDMVSSRKTLVVLDQQIESFCVEMNTKPR